MTLRGGDHTAAADQSLPLLEATQEAYIHGVSTRKVDELVRAMGLDGVDKSAVSRLCSDLDEVVNRFRTRALERPYPYVWVDATYIKCRDDGRVISMAFVVAMGVNATGEREVLGFDLGPSEDGEFWLEFLRGLVSRGLSGGEGVLARPHRALVRTCVIEVCFFKDGLWPHLSFWDCCSCLRG